MFTISYCLSLARPSDLVKYLRVRQGAYPKVEHLKGSSLWWAFAALLNIRLGWKGFPVTNTRTVVNYGRKSLITLGSVLIKIPRDRCSSLLQMYQGTLTEGEGSVRFTFS
jgi:hypothetical protein